MKIALAQVDTTVGDLRGNLELVRSRYRRAAGLGVELVVFPELTLPGYPPCDLLEQEGFVAANLKALGSLAREAGKAALCVGYVDVNPSRAGKPFFNAAAVLHRGKVAARRFKTLLPTYDVFDESRYFEPAPSNPAVSLPGLKLGVTICEDAWNDEGFWKRRLYPVDPLRRQAPGAKVLVNLSASPYHRGKAALRLRMFQSHARATRRPLLFCNLVGGNDELIFDGNSFAVDARGRVTARGRPFEEDLVVVDTEAPTAPGGTAIPYAARDRSHPLADPEEVSRALELGLRDYVRKCGFKDVLIGLSGGIDSALVCALAARSLGSEHVTGVSMPSMYSSPGSITDAQGLCDNLGVKLISLPITGIYDSYITALDEPFRGTGPGLAEQNLQARIRGALLMALSNKTGALVLSTGNKSELSVGYCTLYGDMSGGLAVISDVPKTTVYELARWINKDGEVIPASSLSKPPSAELKPDQRDQDDLPPYDVLDKIVRSYVEEGRGAAAISRQGFSRTLVDSILRRIDASEYKRRQGAPGLRITPKAFGIGRRMPIARGRNGGVTS